MPGLASTWVRGASCYASLLAEELWKVVDFSLPSHNVPRRRPARGEQGEEERVRQTAEHCASERIERPSAEARRSSAAPASERAGVNCGV